MTGGDGTGEIDLELRMSFTPEHPPMLQHSHAARGDRHHPPPSLPPLAESSSSSSSWAGVHRHFLSRPPPVEEHPFFPERQLLDHYLATSRQPINPPALGYSAGALASPNLSVAAAAANESLLVAPRPSRGSRGRRSSGRDQHPAGRRAGEGKEEKAAIVPPYPWATNLRAVVHSKSYLLRQGIRAISGGMKCRRCERQAAVSYDLEQAFAEVKRFIKDNKHLMHDRAPARWTAPSFPPCPGCKAENAMRPAIGAKKREINWLFLLLSQTLGCCTLEQLKYFCKHTKNHRTGAKDRVLYLAFLGICKQLEPLPLFDFDT